MMLRFHSAGQLFFQANWFRLILVLAGLFAAAAAGWFFLGEPGTVSVPPPAEALRPAENGRLLEKAPESVAPVVSESLPTVEPPPAPPAPAPSVPRLGVMELERQFRGADSSEERSDLAHQIAGRNDAAAVVALGRIFRTERHPAVKAAILSALGDVDASMAPEERLATLDSALRGQPRDVRITALGSLTQLKDPGSLALLLHASQEDPDAFVRETAAALYKARKEASEP